MNRALVHRFCLLLAALLSFALLSCGGEESTEPDPKNDPGQLTISLGQTSALPGTRIPISGVPESQDLDGVYARIQDVDTDGESVTYVGRDGDGIPFLVAPLRPVDTELVAGGDVLVTLAGETTSNSVPLTIESLPTATTTIQEQVTQLQDLATAWFAFHGTNRAELRALDVNAIPTRLFPLWVAQELLDNPGNPNSLRAMVDGPVPLLDNEVIDFDLVNRLLSLSDLTALIEEEATGVEALESLGNLQDTQNQGEGRGDLSGLSQTGCIDGGAYGITSATDLDRAMTAARFAINRLDGASGQYTQDLASFMSVMGTIPQLKGLATVVGAGLYVYTAVNQAASSVLPSAFNNSASDFDIQDKETFFEDDEGGNWANFKVTAVSQGWKMDQFILEAIATVAGFQDFGGFTTITDGLGALARNMTDFAINNAVARAIAAAANGSSIVEICPGTWPDIDISEPAYSEASIPVGTSIEFINSTFFETRETGVSEIRLETRSGMFGGAPPAIKQKPVEVLLIDVTVTPETAEMDLQETRSFSAVVTNAHDDRVEWTVPAGLEEISRSDFGKTITVKTPNTVWSPPFALIARSQANTGSREGKVDSDPREGGAVISLGLEGIRVLPVSECLSPGDTLRFVAQVVGIEEYELLWKVESGWGSITQTGLYTAPSSGTSDDVISAEVVGRPDLIDRSSVHVGECQCEFEITVGGASAWHVGGSVVFYQIFGTSEEGIIQWTFDVPEEVGLGGFFVATVAGTPEQPMPSVGETGSWRINASYASPSGESWVSSQEDSVAGLTLDITEHTSTAMEGSMWGTAVQRDDPQDPERITSTVFITVPFRAGYFDGASFPCID